jgi:hypothetical protein
VEEYEDVSCYWDVDLEGIEKESVILGEFSIVRNKEISNKFNDWNNSHQRNQGIAELMNKRALMGEH